jgi:hypothetical protein
VVEQLADDFAVATLPFDEAIADHSENLARLGRRAAAAELALSRNLAARMAGFRVCDPGRNSPRDERRRAVLAGALIRLRIPKKNRIALTRRRRHHRRR